MSIVDAYKVSAVQMSCEFLNIEANVSKAIQFIENAALDGAKLIVLPEAFNTGYYGGDIWMQHSGVADLAGAYNKGVENVPYEMLSSLPGGAIVIPLFVILIFLSTVTACDSNAITMAGISSSGISPDSPETPKWLKIVWTIIAMWIGYIMIASVGVNGVKIIANFGGMFAALIMIAATGSLIVLIKHYKKFDQTMKK